ncbi:Retrovirus-related Pol polyprotein from transposon 297 [Araneus ventricosus]|uniref:RNA-directed DNA polymerase n=1 Tax=Araneus ventricosus TaxID=182803 RepID=A0A4Y2EUX2_ARAVE|nr:Retrovirus-related Pol polyprotein from transposon 297 [Araneus ventricosus]
MDVLRLLIPIQSLFSGINWSCFKKFLHLKQLPNNCAFGQKRVKSLGHIVGSGQHSPDPEKAVVLRNLSRPSTKKELRSFLGLASYYRDYIPNFSEIVLPLTDLTKRKVPNVFPWSIEAEAAFVKIKDELIRMPTLHTPDISHPFWLYTDASATAIGACLAQHDDVGKELPIAFFSKKHTPTQMKWSTIEREAFCVLEALKKFDTWVFGGKIQGVSDHNPLTYLTNSVPHGAWNYRDGHLHCSGIT